MHTHCKPTETFQYTHFCWCHHPGGKKGFIKDEALRFLRKKTLLKIYLKSSSKILNHAYVKELIPRILFKGPSQRCNLKSGNWHSFKTHRRAIKSCLSFSTMGLIHVAAILAIGNIFRTPSLELKCLGTSFGGAKPKFTIPRDSTWPPL